MKKLEKKMVKIMIIPIVLIDIPVPFEYNPIIETKAAIKKCAEIR